jgi:uncharacterized membrane protein
MQLKKYFITGLVIWVPLTITLWVLHLVVGTLDQSLLLLPAEWRPRRLVGVDIPGFGAVLTLLVVFLTGVVGANYFGQRLVGLWESVLGRIPFVKSIYSSVKQVSDTLFAPNGQAFRKALLVEYPRQGSWTVAFQTGAPGAGIAEHLEGEFVSLYVPTTPNPTSGFFLMVPRESVVELDMTVDEALKYIISMGVVAPAPNGAPAKR